MSLTVVADNTKTIKKQKAPDIPEGKYWVALALMELSNELMDGLEFVKKACNKVFAAERDLIENVFKRVVSIEKSVHDIEANGGEISAEEEVRIHKEKRKYLEYLTKIGKHIEKIKETDKRLSRYLYCWQLCRLFRKTRSFYISGKEISEHSDKERKLDSVYAITVAPQLGFEEAQKIKQGTKQGLHPQMDFKTLYKTLFILLVVLSCIVAIFVIAQRFAVSTLPFLIITMIFLIFCIIILNLTGILTNKDVINLFGQMINKISYKK